MSNFAAEEVAKEVLGNIGKGIKPNITRIAIKKGLKAPYAGSGQVQKTKAYQRVTKPVALRWEKERERITKAMEKTELSEVEYKDLAKVLDTLTQNIQLLNGGATANIAQKVLVEFIDAKDNSNTS